MSIVQKIKKRIFKEPQAPSFFGELPFFNVLQHLLENLTDMEDFEFLQIGAADGASKDPIFDLVKKHRWNGSLIEPSPISYEKLVENYNGHSNLEFRNYLVSDQSEKSEQAFYEIKKEFRGSVWTEQCSSLSHEMVLESLLYLAKDEGLTLPDDPKDAISETLMPCVHISDVVQDLGITRLDLLLVDTMGHDARILKAFPFETVQPKFVMFEHYLLPTSEKMSVLKFLASQGYAFVKYSVDTIAVKSDSARRWSVSEW